MATHTISLYCVSAFNYKSERSENRLAVLDDVHGIDVISVFKDFLDLNKRDDLVRDEEDKTVFAVDDYWSISSGRCLVGIVNAGQYGVPGKIRDAKTGSHRFDKNASDADVTDRIFLFYSPKGKDEAILALHNIRNHGVKGVLTSGLKDLFRHKTGLTLRFEGLSYDKAAQKWLDAQVKEIKATEFKTSSDITDDLNGLGHEHSELILKPKRNGTFGKFRALKENKPRAITTLEQHSDKVKAVVEVDGNRRTFQVSGTPGMPIVKLEVEDEMIKMDGMPDFAKMEDWLVEVVNELCQSVYRSQEVYICQES
ncbi:hypothetical protein SAMN05661010_00055 [Modicisalibacter muralis]|uniref:Uncharacterized protein n=1 Tax=Modicisalibacter muralis TaxID=119000 RepID=A0A1G9EPC5_9GAMM|nr:hypothetical protein [Halomonas muralis]SDK77980.1 hypothetical protein SAMN05661010_00055 [Halomonas muralis]